MAKAAETAHYRKGKHTKQGKKKKKLQRVHVKIAPGERKAFRKRIQLSSNNAFPVPGVETLTSATLTDKSSVGKVCAISDEVVDQLRGVEAFKATQNFAFFHKPSVLIRSETIKVAAMLEEAVAKKETAKLVIDGERLSGKSTLLQQTMTAAFLRNWIVIHVPEGQLSLASSARCSY
jgi:small subunit ribosomal protein S29